MGTEPKEGGRTSRVWGYIRAEPEGKGLGQEIGERSGWG